MRVHCSVVLVGSYSSLTITSALVMGEGHIQGEHGHVVTEADTSGVSMSRRMPSLPSVYQLEKARKRKVSPRHRYHRFGGQVPKTKLRQDIIV